MAVITPILDTLLHEVLGKRNDPPPRRDNMNEAVKPAASGDGPLAVRSDSRLQQRQSTPLELPQLRGRAVGEAASRAGQARGRGEVAPPSSQSTFSPAARAIADVLSRFSESPSVLRAGAPLMNASEAPDSRMLAARIQESINSSGLFYESHLQRWYRGEMSLQQIAREPQARLWTASAQPRALTGQPTPAPATIAALLPTAVVVPRELPVTMGLPTGMSSVSAAGQQANAAYTALASAQPASGAGVPTPEAGQTAQAAALQEANTVNDPASASRRAQVMDESLQGVVRQQLELLANPILRWEGDVWSGIFMALAIHPPAQGRQGQQGRDEAEEQGNDENSEGWQSTLSLQVKGLGQLGVKLWLHEDRLNLHLDVDDADALRQLESGQERLRERMEACGLRQVELSMTLRETFDEQ